MKRTVSCRNIVDYESNKENCAVTADSHIISFEEPQKIYKETDLQKRYGIGYNQTLKWQNFIPFSYDVMPLQYLHIGSIFDPILFSFIQYYGRHPESKHHIVDFDINYPNNYQMIVKMLDLKNNSPEFHIHENFVCPKFDILPKKYFDLIFVGENITNSNLYSYFDTFYEKLNRGGYFIFENYLLGDREENRKCIDTLLKFYKNNLRYLGNDADNIFIVKI
jgi:hypothetical protein